MNKEDWTSLSINEKLLKYDIDKSKLYEIAYKEKLYNEEPIIERNRWTKCEEFFLEKYKENLSIRDFSNIFHKSYYATLQKVKLMGMYELINRK